jgi:regulator of RNase E activity RraB
MINTGDRHNEDSLVQLAGAKELEKEKCAAKFQGQRYQARPACRCNVMGAGIRCGIVMAENWKSYFCNVNGSLASIFVNLGLRDEVPIVSKPWLLWVWLYLKEPRTDGLSANNEAPVLYKIEDTICESASRACQAIHCGRITTEGRREFYFYGEEKEGFRESIEATMTDYKGYRFEIGDEWDPKWNQYLDPLYPSPEDYQRIANMDVLDALSKNGDVHSVPREIRHWIYFPNKLSRERFKHEVGAVGYRIVSESTCEGERPFGLSIARSQSVEPHSIDAAAIELLHMADGFDGEYDGWETQVITQLSHLRKGLAARSSRVLTERR